MSDAFDAEDSASDKAMQQLASMVGRIDERSAASWRNYEDKAVREVLKLTGLSRLGSVIAREVNDRTGFFQCNFPTFHQYVDSPLRFDVGTTLAELNCLTLPDLYDRFETTPVFEGFLQVVDRIGLEAGSLCFIFNYRGGDGLPGPKGGKFMTCHTQPSTLSRTTRITREVVLGKHPISITIETLNALLAGNHDRFRALT